MSTVDASVTRPAGADPNPAASPRHLLLAAALLVLAALAAYHNSFSGPFIFDDDSSIADNPTLRRLGTAFFPPHAADYEGGLTVGGRPLVNFSLALNYAVSGTAVWSYHALNLLIHLLAGLTLFGVVRRTLLSPVLRPRFTATALPVAFGAALLWIVHPLQTEAVTYIVQRAESLMALCYLLTLYGAIRAMECHDRNDRPGAASAAPMGWMALSWLACLAGMACKEVMVSAPVIVLLYDRTFFAGSFGAAWRRRGKFYSSLAATWLLLACLVAGTGARGGTAGLNSGVTWGAYLATQCWAIARYLRLAFWPHPLVFDYGTGTITAVARVLPGAFIVALLAVATVRAIRRQPAWGFAGAFFFALLAPSSLVPVATQTIAEHRMYLPLAIVVSMIALALHALLGKRSLPVMLAIAAGWGFFTSRRNEDYRSKLAIWQDTAAKYPINARAQYNLGNALLDRHHAAEAMSRYAEAIRLEPDNASAHYNYGNALAQSGRFAEAIGEFQSALRLQPASLKAHNNLGLALAQSGRTDEARAQFEETLRLHPDNAEAHNNLGMVLAQSGRPAEAIAHYEAALQAQPGRAETHNNLASALADTGRLPEAIAHYEEALRLKPDSPGIHLNLADVLFAMKRNEEAVAHCETALQLSPGNTSARIALARLQVKTGHPAEAITVLQEGLRLAPGDPDLRSFLQRVEDYRKKIGAGK